MRSTAGLAGEVRRYPNSDNATIDRRFFVRATSRTPGRGHDLGGRYAS